jgi:hypothetical protein
LQSSEAVAYAVRHATSEATHTNRRLSSLERYTDLRVTQSGRLQSGQKCGLRNRPPAAMPMADIIIIVVVVVVVVVIIIIIIQAFIIFQLLHRRGLSQKIPRTRAY